ncbi:MAG: tetratricopeptide repeat protein [Spirochaetes bacterium]|nr:tetratricopeptide repeat protein [Spirochaetota bacterium]
MAVKKTEINYTPEELSEINRIINVITESGDIHEEKTVAPTANNIPKTIDHDINGFDIEDTDINLETDIEDITDSIANEEDITYLKDSDLSFVDEPSKIDTFDEEFEDEKQPDDIKEDSFSLEKDEDFDIPDINEISMKDGSDLPEAGLDDISSIEIEDFDTPDEPKIESSGIDEIDEIPDSFTDIDDEVQTPIEKTESSPLDELVSLDDDFADIDNIPDAFTETKRQDKIKNERSDDDFIVEDRHDDETLTIEPLDDDIVDYSDKNKTSSQKDSRGISPEISLSEQDIARLKKSIIHFNPEVREVIRKTVVNDMLPQNSMKKLVDMIITGKSEDSIRKFLEKKLKTKIAIVDESASKRKVITSRPEYSREGRERQKKLFMLTSAFGITVILSLLITIISYQFIYKPYMAKKLIKDGVALILKSSQQGERFDRKNNYDEAERLFREVDEKYKKDYLYGYNEYGRAYLWNKDYRESVEKLNGAYHIDKNHTDTTTLNNLGYFYAKTDKDYFETLKPNIKEWYFKDNKDIPRINSPLDLAFIFYRRTLAIDNNNINALLGIGNAYFYQGQYLNAKKYYEDILRVDPNSVIGYSGLLNLYIERDAFPQVATILADLRQKKMLSDLPSALIAKLAGYLIDKRGKGDSNIRIDYGVTSGRLVDSNDNTDPAIIEVLHALNDRDPDYPPLHIQFARFHRAKNNMFEMERYLDKALSLSPQYFSALNLKGEFYYSSKDPVRAYRSFKDALNNYGNQPEFTRDEFYKETEDPGKTNAYLGNIFYYYFDKVKSREGGLDDEIVNNEIEKMENYSFAQKYYIDALNLNFASPELYYNMGRIHYLKGEYSLSLNLWLHLYDDFVKSPELMLALGNAFYNSSNSAGIGNYDAAKGEYLKLLAVMEYEADKIRTVDLSKASHIKLFQTLSSAYNNLGAVYQNTGEYQKRDIAYWKSIDYAQKMSQENEYARVNLARSNRNAEPLLDKTIPFSIDIYREDMRN